MRLNRELGSLPLLIAGRTFASATGVIHPRMLLQSLLFAADMKFLLACCEPLVVGLLRLATGLL